MQTKNKAPIVFAFVMLIISLGIMIFFKFESLIVAGVIVMFGFPFSIATTFLFKELGINIFIALILNFIYWFYLGKGFIHFKEKYKYQDTDE